MTDRPLILVTNDDGILSPGISALADAAAEFGEVRVVAPDREMSAVSHSITLNRPIRIQELGAGRYAVDGTPVDCVHMGVHHIAERPPALILSGINRGPNLGIDVLYSGTVAGAREGAIQGYPSIAFSLVSRDAELTRELGPVVREIVAAVLANGGLPRGLFLNVNVPKRRLDPLAFQATTLGHRAYSGTVVRRLDPRGKEYLWIGGGDEQVEQSPGSDIEAVRAGMISVTPLPLFGLPEDHLAAMSEWPLFRSRP